MRKGKNIDAISKAVTHYAFSYGPVEDMHAIGQLPFWIFWI
ncbi:MAG: hypothetical protein ACLR0U_12230 [Enterocloster clostridioformis]